MINRQQLHELVMAFREAIEPCWSEESAYKMPGVEQYGAYIPTGQCAVSCLVLMGVLVKDFPATLLCLSSGQLQSITGDILIHDHAWLKLGDGEDAIIVDVTADQASAITDQIIIGTISELKRRGVCYIETELESGYGEEEHPGRFVRYKLLKEAFRSKD